MLKTFALRGRETPITIYGPAGLRDLFGSLRRIFGRLTYPYELVELEPGDGLERDGYELETFAVDHGVSAVGYALVEEDRPGRFDVEWRTRSVCPGPERGALQAGEEVTLAGGRVVQPDEVLGPPRPGRKLVIAGDTAPFRASSRPRAAPTSSSTRRRSSRTSASALATPRTRRRPMRRRSLATPAWLCSRSHICRTGTPGATPHGGGRSVFPETVVPRDFDIIELPFRERGAPRLVKAGGSHRGESAEALTAARAPERVATD